MYTGKVFISLFLVTLTVACGDGITQDRAPWTIEDQMKEVPSTPVKEDPRPRPVQKNIVSLEDRCAINKDNSITCWGAMSPYNAVPGQFKHIDTSRGFCGVTMQDRAVCYVFRQDQTLAPISFINEGLANQPVTDIVRSGTSTCIAIADGAPRCWRDDRIQEGMTIDDISYTINNADDVRTLVAGTHRFCGLTRQGVAHCWGTSPHTFDPTSQRPPDIKTAIVLDQGRRWASIDIYNRFCGVDLEGQLHCRGRADQPQITLGPVRGEDRFAQVKMSVTHGCARTEMGRLYCWGTRNKGSLGFEPVVEQEHPSASMKQVDTDAVFVDIGSGGHSSNCGLTQEGAVLCWGQRGSSDNLGQDAQMYIDAPQVVAPETSWTSFAFNGKSICAITTEQDTYCWGKSLTDNKTLPIPAEHHTPKKLQTPIQFSKLSMGQGVACGLGSARGWHCWGDQAALEHATKEGTAYSRLNLPAGTRLDKIALSHTATAFGCGLTERQQLMCWGHLPLHAPHGDGSDPGDYQRQQTRTITSPRLMFPTIKWSSVALIGDNVCGLTTDGQLMCWGDQFTSRAVAVPEDGGPLHLHRDQRFDTLTAVSNDTACVKDSSKQISCFSTPQREPSLPAQAEKLDILRPLLAPFEQTRAFAHNGELCVEGPQKQVACQSYQSREREAITLSARRSHPHRRLRAIDVSQHSHPMWHFA